MSVSNSRTLKADNFRDFSRRCVFRGRSKLDGRDCVYYPIMFGADGVEIVVPCCEEGCPKAEEGKL